MPEYLYAILDTNWLRLWTISGIFATFANVQSRIRIACLYSGYVQFLTRNGICIFTEKKEKTRKKGGYRKWGGGGKEKWLKTGGETEQVWRRNTNKNAKEGYIDRSEKTSRDKLTRCLTSLWSKVSIYVQSTTSDRSEIKNPIARSSDDGRYYIYIYIHADTE